MTDFLKIAKSIAFHFAHICAYGVETVKAPLPQRPAGILADKVYQIKKKIKCMCAVSDKINRQKPIP